MHICQPDALHFDLKRGRLTIFEVKHAHTVDAWWQLKELYRPVVRAMFPQRLWKIRLVEIVRYYDADAYFPQPYSLIPDLFHPLPEEEIGVFIWRPSSV